MKKRLLKESGGNVSETVNHIEEYLDKLMAIGKNKGVFQDKPLREKINKLGHKMLVNINKFAHAIENYHPPHDHDHDHDHDHKHDSHGYNGQNFVDRRKKPSSGSSSLKENKRVIKLTESDIKRIVKRVILKEGGENIKGIVDHIEEELDNLQGAAVDSNLFGDREIGHKMQSLWSEAMISFNDIVNHIESYHPKSDKNHKEHNKDIKNTKHGAPIASNKKVNESRNIKKIIKRVLNEQMEFEPKGMDFWLEELSEFAIHLENGYYDEHDDLTEYDIGEIQRILEYAMEDKSLSDNERTMVFEYGQGIIDSIQRKL